MSFRICHFLCVHTREDTFTIVHMLGGVHVYLHTWRIYGTLLHCHADITRHMANTQGTHAGQMSGQSHFLICECSYNSYHRYRQTLSLTHTHRCVWEYWCMRILMYVQHIHQCISILVHEYSRAWVFSHKPVSSVCRRILMHIHTKLSQIYTYTHNWWETRVHIHKTLSHPHTHAPDGGYWRTCPRKSTRCAS